MNKVILGIGIPYYKNSEQCEVAFKKLMKTLDKQITNEMRLFIYEDGQVSEWLKYYNRGYTFVMSNPENKGVAYARNQILDFMIIQQCDYILYIDSDDMVDCDYLQQMYEACVSKENDIIESPFYVNKKEYHYNIRDNVAGCSIKMELIKGIRFNENFNISEDTLFIHDIFDKYKDLKRFMIESKYYYNYGINPNSLMMKFGRNEIKLRND